MEQPTRTAFNIPNWKSSTWCQNAAASMCLCLKTHWTERWPGLQRKEHLGSLSFWNASPECFGWSLLPPASLRGRPTACILKKWTQGLLNNEGLHLIMYIIQLQYIYLFFLFSKHALNHTLLLCYQIFIFQISMLSIHQ